MLRFVEGERGINLQCKIKYMYMCIVSFLDSVFENGHTGSKKTVFFFA